MALALLSGWRRGFLASGSLLVLGACGAMTSLTTPEAPQDPPAAVVDRSPRVAAEIARGRQALAAGDLGSAQSAFTAALRGSPNDPEPAIGLAETYVAMGDLETAGRLFDIVASAEGGASDARLLQGRGLVALGQGRTDDAINLLEESVGSDPGLWRAWAGLGRAYGRNGNTRQARSAFNRAEESAPTPAVVINDMGMLHLEENDPAAALEAFQRALAVDPGNAVASANARIARAMLGEYDAAISGARPEELPDVLNNVGYIAVVNGDFDVADRFLRRAIEISPVYHEAAAANLDLLAQAMRGETVGALAGQSHAGSGVTAGAEPAPLVAAAAEDAAGVPASPAVGGVATAAWSAVQPGPGAPATSGPIAEAGTTRAMGLASVPAAADAGGGVMAHGFRWESQPLSAAPAKKRGKRRAARSSTPPDEADPRGAAWPAISIPQGESADEPGEEAVEETPQQTGARDGIGPAAPDAEATEAALNKAEATQPAAPDAAASGAGATGPAPTGPAPTGAAATADAAAAGAAPATEPDRLASPAAETGGGAGLPR